MDVRGMRAAHGRQAADRSRSWCPDPQRTNTLLIAQTGHAVSRIGLEWPNTGGHWVQCAEFTITDAVQGPELLYSARS